MSYWIYLEDENGPVEVSKHEGEGSTYAIGGSTKADISITYNYSWPIRAAAALLLTGMDTKISEEVWWGWRVNGLWTLDDVKAFETIVQLVELVDVLGKRRPDEENYWLPTPGNASHVLNILLSWARQHPDATWRVS